MGTEQSCCAPSNDKPDQPIPIVKLTISPTGKYVQCEPYPLAETVNHIYQQLFHQFSSNKYLDLQLPPNTTGIRELEGHYKLTNIDASYHGEWKDHQPHGRGLATLANGSLLVGTFSQGTCFGDHNYIFFKDGSQYVGNIIGNRISGRGKLTTSALVYEGQWHDNLPQGEGTETYTNGDRFIGTFEKGLKQGVDCTFIWAKHESYAEYKGGFWEGRISGEGKLTLHNKTTLQGFFDGNSITNLTFTSSKLKFVGNFEGGKANGKGMLEILDSNQSFNGNFRQGKLYGSCRARDSKGRETDMFAFDGRQFKRLVGISDAEAQKILKVIEGAYVAASKHSDALIEISQDLQEDYECRFVEPFENLFKYSSYLAVNVFDKVLLVRSKKL